MLADRMEDILAILAFLGLALAVAVVVRAFRMPRAKGSMMEVSWRLARWVLAALLAASGILIAASPRADQPLLDGMERAFPAIRSAYMDGNTPVSVPEGAQREARSRAREKNRWWIAGVLVALALSLVVSLPSRRTTPRNFGGERGSTEP